MSELVTTGFSMGLMNSIFSIGSVILQGSINTLGTSIIAAHTAARRIVILETCLFQHRQCQRYFRQPELSAQAVWTDPGRYQEIFHPLPHLVCPVPDYDPDSR